MNAKSICMCVFIISVSLTYVLLSSRNNRNILNRVFMHTSYRKCDEEETQTSFYLV